jgi:ATP-dependent helicase/nuclease subunit B
MKAGKEEIMSSLQFVLGGSGAGKSERLSRYVCDMSVKEPDKNFFVVVPEQYTMSTQKKLVNDHKRHGILNIDVVSFERLAYKVFEELGGQNRQILDDTGKNLIVRKVLESNKSKLVFFGNSINKTGFVSELKSVISELLQYGITPEDVGKIKEKVKNKQQLSAKLEDISLIYGEFMGFLSENYITSEEILDVLCDVVGKSELIAGSELIFDGFTGFTPIQYRLLQLLLRYSRGVKVSVTIDRNERVNVYEGMENLFFMSKEMISKLSKICDEEQLPVLEHIFVGGEENVRFREAGDLAFLEKNLFRYNRKHYKRKTENIYLYEAGSPKEEIQYIASQILQLTRFSGFSYGDIAVVTADLENYGKVAENIFGQNDIPSFLDYKRKVTDNPFVELIRSALEIIEKGYAYEAVFKYLRTGMTGLEREDIDMVENYCLAVGIRGSKVWHEKWKKRMRRAANVDMERINSLRESIITPFIPLETVLKDKNSTVRDCVTVLYHFVVSLECEKKLSKLAELEETGSEYGQVYGRVMELFDRLVELLGEQKVSSKEFRAILSAGFEEIKVGVLPQSTDCVVIGDIERTRLDNVKVIFFAGVNDSVVPKKNENRSVLSETDRNLLQEQQIVLSPSPREKSFVQRFYLYLIMTKASHKLYISYAKKNSEGKSLLPSYLIRNIKQMFPDVPVESIEGKRQQFAYIKIPKSDIAWSEENYIKTISENAASLLYGDELRGSVSAFEKYAECHFAYFLQYGLRISEREEYRFAVNDFGTVLHSVLEEVSRSLKEQKRSFSRLTDEERHELAAESISRISADYGNSILLDSSRNEFLIKRLTDIADRTILTIGQQLERGLFVPDAYEQHFLIDEKDFLKNKAFAMQGKIDRIDICEDEENVYVRVVDYKTGKSDFNLQQTYYGLKLQLITYLRAAQHIEKKRHSDKNIIPAGILYYNIDNPIVDISEESFESEEEYIQAAEDMIMQELRMKGVVNDNKEIIRKMDDRGGKSAVIPVKFKSDGELDRNSHVYSTQQFEMLEKHVTKSCIGIAKEIFEGNVDINPYESGQQTACEYCPYHAVCGFAPENGYRHFKKLKDEQIWKNIREEKEANGESVD